MVVLDMEIDKFDEVNDVMGTGEDAFYLHKAQDEDNRIVICWKLSIFERIGLLFTGRIWQQSLLYGDGLQTTAISVDKPVMDNVWSK